MRQAKRILNATLELVVNKDIKKFYAKALKYAPKEFWTAPSSSSGKYHPSEDNGVGGLVRHTLKTILIAHTLAYTEYYLSHEKKFYKDICVVAAGCHDIKKNGEPWGKHTVPEHGILAANYLDNFELKGPAKRMIQDAVRYHMNNWHPEEERNIAMDPTRPSHVRIIQYADMVAVREWSSWMPKISSRKSNIPYSLRYLNPVIRSILEKTK